MQCSACADVLIVLTCSMVLPVPHCVCVPLQGSDWAYLKRRPKQRIDARWTIRKRSAKSWTGAN
jgi:hypothetical protein